PVWWQYRHLSDQDWDHLSYIADFTRDIDFANVAFAPLDIENEQSDIFVLAATDQGFGWLRRINQADTTQTIFNVPGLKKGKYWLQWFDTWSGKYMQKVKIKVKKGVLEIAAPPLVGQQKDIAFKVKRK
ncbi:MAG: hypothetical protein HKN76_18740, partial [Saprospiraceae bacterium]|nr:hypothetical protein [Saprospiraceae bacterium]